MNEDKQQVPAAVVWDNTKKLVPVEFNWAHIMQACQQALTEDKEYVILPVEESQDFKPHKRRLLKDDRESPKGIIQRDSYARERYYPYAPARFNAEELAKYAAKHFNSMSSDDIERMAEEFMRGIDAGVE